jgi:acylphosphatase
MERLHCVVQGRVQGVGFRAFVRARAVSLALTGWVRNVGYDRVEIIAEGPRERLEALLTDLRRGPSMAHVQSVTSEWLPATGAFHAFRVRASR